MKRAAAIAFCFALALCLTFAGSAQAESEPPAEVMLIGVFHFANPVICAAFVRGIERVKNNQRLWPNLRQFRLQLRDYWDIQQFPCQMRLISTGEGRALACDARRTGLCHRRLGRIRKG